MEQPQKFSSSGTEAEEDALLFALDFIDIYAVRRKSACIAGILITLINLSQYPTLSKSCVSLQTLNAALKNISRTSLQCLHHVISWK